MPNPQLNKVLIKGHGCACFWEKINQMVVGSISDFEFYFYFRDLFYPNGETGRSIEVDMLLIDGGKYLFHKSKEFGNQYTFQ